MPPLPRLTGHILSPPRAGALSHSGLGLELGSAVEAAAPVESSGFGLADCSPAAWPAFRGARHRLPSSLPQAQFFVMLLLVFLLETSLAILFFAYTDKIDRYAQRDLKKGLHLYGTPGNVGLTNAWSIIQTDFRCCGVSNYTDWFEVYNATRVPDSCCLEFSESCGLHAPGTWWKAPCYETVKVWLQENLLAVGIFGLCTALVQILGLTFAMTMYCQVVKADTYCA
ncbi:tetraspanin-4 isoform X2 [Mesoplodon densirostris]|uniref:tetraspanin-4 isoform X2 n=1 Tax=Mesoplodon densirostris TaxID=48708 RepID=UPI0028DB8245|nr:tetraspanin-4 isoform X2 [Mesoplodon densirostris]